MHTCALLLCQKCHYMCPTLEPHQSVNKVIGNGPIMPVICTLAPTIPCLKLRMHLHHSTVFIYDLCYALIHFTNPATLFYFPGIYTNVLNTFLYFNFDSCFHLNHFLALCFCVSVETKLYLNTKR